MEEMIHNITITKTLIAGSDQDPIKIYEGIHGDSKDGVTWGKREAAIKRIPKADREKAIIQTRAYMELDQIPKILRCFGAMEDKDFCYIALERAGCNLSEFVWALSQKPNPIRHENDKTKAFLEHNTNFEVGSQYLHPIMIKIIKDVMEAVVHLHRKGIRHLNITPENILLFGDGEFGLTAKLANFTFHKSVDHVFNVNDGTIGWKCPERLRGLPEGLPSDVFNVAMVIFHLVSGGNHRFGKIEDIEQCEDNIKLNHPYKSLEQLLPPDAVGFLKDMLADEATQRPQIETMLSHPLLWEKSKRGDLMCELNNMVQTPGVDTAAEVGHLDAFKGELMKRKDWKKQGWKFKFHRDFTNEVSIQNGGFKYNMYEMEELLRFVRNMLQHYDAYPTFLGSSMDSAYGYLLGDFPEFIVICYDSVKQGKHAATDRFKRFFSN